LLTVAILASFVPARSSAQVDPMEALRAAYAACGCTILIQEE
jgi:hypothetical protein